MGQGWRVGQRQRAGVGKALIDPAAQVVVLGVTVGAPTISRSFNGRPVRSNGRTPGSAWTDLRRRRPQCAH